MLQTIQGIYKNGKIELTETPQGIIRKRMCDNLRSEAANNWYYELQDAMSKSRI